MALDLTNPALQAFLRTLQITWQASPPPRLPSGFSQPHRQLLFILPANPIRRKSNSVSDEPRAHNIRPVDVSAVEASIARLTAAMERGDRPAFLREWSAFLGPGGHLSTARDSPVGRQVMAIVREEGRGVGLRGVTGGIVALAEGKKGGGEAGNAGEVTARENEGVGELAGGGEVAPVDIVEGTGHGESAGLDGTGTAEAPKDDGWVGERGKAVPSGPPAGGW